MMKRLDWPRFEGQWYEVERDRFTFFSWTGICNRKDFTFDSNADKWARQNGINNQTENADHKGLKIDLEPDMNLRYLVTNTQKDRVLRTEQVKEGVIACDDKNVRCYLDFDRVGAAGVPRKTTVTVLGTDYDNWAVMYACHRKLRLLKNEWVWVLSRKPELSDEHR